MADENDDLVYVSEVEEQEVKNAEMPTLKREEPVIKQAVVKTISYPSGVFKINEAKVIFVKQGTAFLKIATENDLSLPRLFEFNDMKPLDVAQKDQLIYLQRKRKIGDQEFHVVKEGESLYDIAQAEGIRLESLLEYNFLKEGMQPAAGEKLNLKWKASQGPRLLATR